MQRLAPSLIPQLRIRKSNKKSFHAAWGIKRTSCSSTSNMHMQHDPNVMHHFKSGEQRRASTGKYWKYLFHSTDERDIILQIYLAMLWICCRLICMTTHYLSQRTRRQLRRRYHLYYYCAVMWRYTEGGNWASKAWSSRRLPAYGDGLLSVISPYYDWPRSIF